VRATFSTRRPEGCPSDLALEELHAGDLAGSSREASLRQPLARCAFCHPRVAALSSKVPPMSPELREAMGAASPSARPFAAPSEQSARRPARPMVALFALGAAAAVALVARPTLRGHDQANEKETNDNRTKGTLTLTVLIRRADGRIDRVNGEGLNGEAHLRESELMSFAVQTTQPSRVVVLGLDTAPSATLYVPYVPPESLGQPAKQAAALPLETASATLLPGSIVADGRPGVERIFAVACPSEAALAPATVQTKATSALALAHGQPEAVTSLGTGCAEASVLLHKEPKGR